MRSPRQADAPQCAGSFIAVRAASAPDFIAPVKPPLSVKDDAR